MINQAKETNAAKQAEMDDLLVQFMACVENNDVDGAASLAYDPSGAQFDLKALAEYWPVKSTDVFEPCGLSYNVKLPNQEQRSSDARAVYLVKSNSEDYQVIMITHSDASGDGIASVNVVRVQELIDAGIEPETSKFPVAKKSFGQWCFTIFWVLSCIFCLVTIIDIIRKKPRLWFLQILLALVFIGAYWIKGPSYARVGMRFGVLNSSGWTRYLDGTNHFELCFPFGAIFYWIRRKSLLKKEPVFAVPAETVPAQAVPAEAIPTQAAAPAEAVPTQVVPPEPNAAEQAQGPQQTE